jgi:hypothetical protein
VQRHGCYRPGCPLAGRHLGLPLRRQLAGFAQLLSR